MTPNDGLDRGLTAWLEDEAAPHAPADLHTRFAEGMGRTRQRPGWATSERWISMETRAHLGALPRTAIALVILGLLLALAAGAIAVGSNGGDGPRNGLLAFAYLGDVYTVQPDGSDRTLLVSEPGTQDAASWSPDGTRLAYWSAPPGGGPRELRVVKADGSEPATVASDVLEDPGWGVVAWSPDGASLVFSARTVPQGQGQCGATSGVLGDFCSSRIFVASADGSTGAVRIGDPDMDARTAAWSPEGTTIAFGGGDAAAGIALHRMAADGSDVRRLSDVSGTAWAFLRLDWSPDGESIVATAGEDEWDIWVFAADGSSEGNCARASRGRAAGSPST